MMTEKDSDDLFARVLGDNLQAATLRLAAYLAIVAAVVATIALVV
jgi:hypothetical protein